MSRGVSDGCDRAANTPPLRCGSASAVSFAGGQASRAHTPGGSRDFGYSALPGGALKGLHAPMEKSSNSGARPSSFGAVVSRSDSAWDAFNESPEFLHSAAVPIASPNRPPSKVEGCRSAALSAKSIDTQGGSLCASWQDHRCLPLRMLLSKFPSKNKIPLVGLPGAGPGGEVQLDAPFGFCLLTFRNREVEEKYRCSRLCRRTSSSLGISFLFLLVLSSLCPVYGKVLCILGAPHNIYLSFTVGCGCLIGLWVVHAAVVAFRKKLKVSDKLTIHLTLFLITLTLLLALAWANAYLCLDAENQQRSLKAFGLGETAADESAGDLFVPSSGGSRRLSLLPTAAGSSSPPAATVTGDAAFADPIAAAAAAAAVPQPNGSAHGLAAASADAALDEPSAVAGVGAPAKAGVGALTSIEDKAHDLLHANMFVLLLIMTLSVVAVYSLTDFSPAFLAWSWPLYLLFPVLTVTTTVISNFLLNHNLSAEATYMAFLLSLVIWGCGFANRYVCEAEHRAEFFFSEVGMLLAAGLTTTPPVAAAAARRAAPAAAAVTASTAFSRLYGGCVVCCGVQGACKRMQPQTPMGSMASVHKGAPAVSTAVEELQKLALAALRLVKAARVAAAEGPGSYLSDNLFVQLHAVVAELLATLAKTEALYSSRVMHALVDTAAAQRWLASLQRPSAALLEDFSWSADASMATPVCFQGRQQLPSSREIVYSSRLVDEGHWQSRRLASMDSSAVCSGSDWHKLPSEGVAREPLTRTNSPSFLAPAFAAAAAAEVVDGSSKLPRSKEALRQANQHAALSEANVSPVHDTFNTGGVDKDAAAAGAGTAAAGAAEAAVVSSPSTQLLTSLARSFLAFSPSQPRKPSIGSKHSHGGGGQGVGGVLVEELLEMQLQAFKSHQNVRRQKEIVSELMSPSHVLYEENPPFASPAFAGVGVDWDLDILSLAQNHQGALQQVGFVLMRPFVDLLGCGLSPLLQLLQQLEARYDPELPYHTATHACQVAHAAMVLNAEMGLDHCKEKVGSFCLCLAAIAHDVGHLGKTNGFLQQSRHPLATLYNDQSIMENFHASLLFRIINEIPSANIFRSQSAEAYQSMRQQIIALILATDMKDHVDLMSRCRIKRSSPNFNCLRREEDAVHVRKMLLKMADLSHTLLCWRDHFTWVCKISEEFYRQGDAERRLKLPVSPVCNRECHQFLAQNQVAFMKILVEPLLCEIEGIEQAVENQKSSPPLVSETLRMRYESNVERWTLLESSGVYIVIDNETLSRGFYRGTNSRERRSEEVGCVPGGHDLPKH
ncbi:hypothetical protein Emed_000617 [Eimeria media]